ncbi:MAG TPA: zinc ribbon domain-containing protein [Vicinamibacterales bacterium]|nr:zinc ribbon domain-containing protein [Vicinamibacterales bacterium]
MSSGTSTERRSDAAGTFQPSHFYLIASMVAATAAVMTSRNTHPLALLLLSAAALAAGLVGLALHASVAGFFSLGQQSAPPSERAVEVLQREKGLVLRSIKELEFDHAMGKVSDADFKDIGGRLRTRALALMQDIERAAHARETSARAGARTESGTSCSACGKPNDDDARFCKHCGARL